MLHYNKRNRKLDKQDGLSLDIEAKDINKVNSAQRECRVLNSI